VAFLAPAGSDYPLIITLKKPMICFYNIVTKWLWMSCLDS